MDTENHRKYGWPQINPFFICPFRLIPASLWSARVNLLATLSGIICIFRPFRVPLRSTFSVFPIKSPESMNENLRSERNFAASFTKNLNRMKRTILIFGLISGFIASSFMAVSMIWVSNHSTTEVASDMDQGMFIGYASMLVAFSFIFVAIKTYRDKYQGGSITFWQGLKMGLMIALIGSTMYVITWAFIYNFVMPDFMQNYSDAALAAARSAGKTEAEIAALTTEMAGYAEIYKSPIGFTLFTYMEILPVGILVSLLSALILWLTRKKPLASAG